MPKIDNTNGHELSWGDFDWDYGKDYSSYHCCSIRTHDSKALLYWR